MGRKILGVIVGLAVWLAVAVVAAIVMRTTWPEYVAVMDTMAFTLPMKIARLAIGAIATLCAGWATAWVTRRHTVSTLIPGIVLLLMFIPEHISLWDKFPVWYHLTFLLTLVPLSYAGGRLPIPSSPPAPTHTAATTV